KMGHNEDGFDIFRLSTKPGCQLRITLERIEGQLRPIYQLLLFSGIAGLGRSHTEQPNHDDADQTGCYPPPRSASTRHESAIVGHCRFLPTSTANPIVRFLTSVDLSHNSAFIHESDQWRRLELSPR